MTGARSRRSGGLARTDGQLFQAERHLGSDRARETPIAPRLATRPLIVAITNTKKNQKNERKRKRKRKRPSAFFLLS